MHLVVCVALCLSVAGGLDRDTATSDENESLRRAAIDAITRGDPATSLSLFRQALASRTGSGARWQIRLQLAQVLAALGHFSEAFREYTRALEDSTSARAADSEMGVQTIAAGGADCLYHVGDMCALLLEAVCGKL